MTTEQLRKEIIVTHWSINGSGISIKYFRKIYLQKDYKELELNPEECARQLSAIDSIDSWEEYPIDPIGILIHYNGSVLNWNAFYPKFKLSQWEALTLAIRHEYELSLEQDSNMMNLTNSINKLNQHK